MCNTQYLNSFFSLHLLFFNENFVTLSANTTNERTKSTMKITLLQQDTTWRNPQENRQRAESAILATPGSDLYLLPEMWATGFVTQPEGMELESDRCLAWMLHMAKHTDAAIAGSLAVRIDQEDDSLPTFRNRFYFIKPDGEVSYYDKHHLFTYGGEQHHYTPGHAQTIVTWRGVRFLLLVCYDLRFPVWSRQQDSYDALLYTANWPSSRIEAWRTLLKARAIENQAYVCGVNRVGSDPSCSYCGGTTFVDPYGHAAECAANIETSLTASIDMERLRAFRSKFPVLQDRDAFSIL